MTRRTTVITPTTQTDAVYELPSQPFARRIVSASIYGFDTGIVYHATTPELKIADVEGNVLASIGLAVDMGAGVFNPANFYFADLGGSQWNLFAPISLGPPVYLPSTIPEDLIIPESNLFTLTLWGSISTDTFPNLVLITEDEDQDFLS